MMRRKRWFTWVTPSCPSTLPSSTCWDAVHRKCMCVTLIVVPKHLLSMLCYDSFMQDAGSCGVRILCWLMLICLKGASTSEVYFI